MSKKDKRLIQWNVDVLSKLLKSGIRARRGNVPRDTLCLDNWPSTHGNEDEDCIPADEVKEIICLPDYNDVMKTEVDPIDPNVPSIVLEQLGNSVERIVSHFGKFDW